MLLVFQEKVLIVETAWECRFTKAEREAWRKRRFQRIEELEMESDGTCFITLTVSALFFLYTSLRRCFWYVNRIVDNIWQYMTTMCIEFRSGKKKDDLIFSMNFSVTTSLVVEKPGDSPTSNKSPSRQLVAMLSAWLQTSTPSGGGKIWVPTFHAGWFWCTMLSKTEPLLFGADRGNWV